MRSSSSCPRRSTTSRARARRWRERACSSTRCASSTRWPGALSPDSLVTGYIDLLVATPSGLVVIDFKTDSPPRDDVRASYPGYVAQVAAYARLLDAAGITAGRAPRSALLFTATGALYWT